MAITRVFVRGVGCCLVRAAAACTILACAGAAVAQRCTPVQLTAPGGAGGDNFGIQVAISGDTVVVGAYLVDVGANTDQGAAYVYRWTGSGWAYEATLTASDGAGNDQFGTAVALRGDTVVVGSSLADVGANADQGAAYVFTRSGTTWSQQAKLTAGDGAADDNFAISVATDGETVVAGTYSYLGAANRGSAYVFARSGATWSEQAKVLASDGALRDRFGSAVAIEGDTAVVSADHDPSYGGFTPGAAYVFTRSGAAWLERARLVASDGTYQDRFGWSVAMSGNTVVVGADFDTVGSHFRQGSVYVYTGAGADWIEQAHLAAAEGATWDLFGYDVSISGDRLVVGCVTGDVGANGNQGSAYVFVRTGSTWAQRAMLTAPDGKPNDQLGVSVGIDGDMIAASANTDDVGANGNQGSAWVFSVSTSTAEAGQDQAIHAGSVVHLDGSGSSDDNTDTADLTFEWSFVERPSGSTATIADPAAMATSFTADRVGTYVVQLIVYDTCHRASEPDLTVVSTTNLPPTASAGNDKVAVINDVVFVSGELSTDPEFDVLSYFWTLTAAPAGSTATLAGETSVECAFVPDLTGVYTLSLVVDDGFGPSAADSVTVTAITGEQYVEMVMLEAIAEVEGLPVTEVTTRGNQQALVRFLAQVARHAQAGNLHQARTTLQNAIERTDGCALRGAPDGNGPGRDWITSCASQAGVYSQLTAALDAITP